MINYNFHTHHYRCKHGDGTIEDYVKEAIKKNIKYLGMSCHLPYPDRADQKGRMMIEELEFYFEDIKKVKALYADQITVLTSMECEYYKRHHDYYQEIRRKCDYLVLGYHFIEVGDNEYIHVFDASEEEQLIKYAKGLAEAVDTGMYDCIAHPDSYLNSSNLSRAVNEKIASIILESARRNNVMIELNANGIREGRNYPSVSFFEYAKEYFPDVKILINSDAHSPSALHDEHVVRGYELATNMGLNIVKDGKVFLNHIGNKK